MSKPMTARVPDYQEFSIDPDGLVAWPGERMRKKLDAIRLPDLEGKDVLDVGCDFGFWSFLAANRGAKSVVGIDRNRPVRGEMFDVVASNREVAEAYPALRVCDFVELNVGKQWHEVGLFDVVFMFSMYHHVFENVGDHAPIWFWLWRQTRPGGVVLWEGPVDNSDGVVTSNMSAENQAHYTRDKILGAASVYFDYEYVGPALHETTRHVFRFTRKPVVEYDLHEGKAEDGAGGATTAFQYADGRRGEEILRAFGVRPYAGSLNVKTKTPFNWDRDYYRVKILDVVDRSQGFESQWSPKWARFYPVNFCGLKPGFVFRFEGEEHYPGNFVEIISSARLRDSMLTDNVFIMRC